ncbi:MAG: serine/threonine protein kinase [Polyangiaceae bacterium]|nr:serine/threonine protein kinase [Polyangiaceae bacterium]
MRLKLGWRGMGRNEVLGLSEKICFTLAEVVDQPPETILQRLKALVFPAKLSAEDARCVEDERTEANRERTAAILPIVALIEIAMLWVFRPLPEAKAAPFREGVFFIHLVVLPINLALLTVANVANRWKMRVMWLGDAVLVTAAALGLAISLNTHKLSPNLNGLIVALLTGTIAMRPTIVGSALAYGGSALGLVVGLNYVQSDPDLRTASLPTGMAAVVLAFALSVLQKRALAREVVLRQTIARQKNELVKWTAELERRVQQQVAETLARTNQVRALDAQLRVKVQGRSRELARALQAGVSPDELAPGSAFANRFVIDKLIGEGAMGDVYAGRDLTTGQVVAIKLLRPWEGMTTVDVKRFVAEAGAAAAVVHSAIVRTFHIDVTEGGQLYHVMELIEGKTLESMLVRGRYDAGQTARLGAVVAEALSVAHAAGVVHRDIKPGNLMLCTKAPGVKILDFGVSKLRDEEHAAVTHAGQVIGTPLYMAPEQVVTGATITGAADVYALGQVLYEMLVGEPAFAGRTVGDVMRAHVSEAAVPVRVRSGGTPADLSGLLDACLSKDPDQRPSAETLAAALGTLADSMGAPPLPALGPPRFAKTGTGIDQLPSIGDFGDTETTLQPAIHFRRPR